MWIRAANFSKQNPIRHEDIKKHRPNFHKVVNFHEVECTEGAFQLISYYN